MTTIEEGIDFMLSHFHEPIFPRRIFTPIQKQIKIENTNEILKYFEESKYYDCRISAFPFLEKWYIKLHGPQRPHILFIDLDASQFKSGRALYLALVQTLRNIQERFNSNSQPTILESGSGGYHIIQPLQAIDLGRVEQFSKWSTDPNKEFLRFAERWLSDGKADYNHYNNVSINNYLLRVPNSINRKTNTEVKIVQRWNGVRPDVRFVYSYFLAYLVDKRNEPHYSGAICNSNWIEYC
ncbi:MAG: hypothetical protein WCF23_20625, partial [Candidatus Nitrosopolaris sp.]